MWTSLKKLDSFLLLPFFYPAILLAWYSVIQAYFMVGNSLQLCWQKDAKKETWFSDTITRKSDKKMATSMHVKDPL
jgi:hypothetical protein